MLAICNGTHTLLQKSLKISSSEDYYLNIYLPYDIKDNFATKYNNCAK